MAEGTGLAGIPDEEGTCYLISCSMKGRLGFRSMQAILCLP